MIRLRPAVPILCILALAACASPRVQCLNDATRDLRVLDELIAETRATIDRGYAIRTVNEPETFFRLCIGGPFDHNVWGSFCRSTQWVERSEPVAVNLVEERGKLDSLLAKREDMARRAALAQAACPAA